jgi:hypothetical protein
MSASVGSTEASVSLLARVGVVGPKRARSSSSFPLRDLGIALGKQNLSILGIIGALALEGDATSPAAT